MTMALTAAQHIARSARRFLEQPLSVSERRPVWRATLDTYAVAVAAIDDPVVGIARRHIAQFATGTGAAASWGDGTRLPAETAAWFNALAGHVFDYDDVLTPMRAHVSVILVPALHALVSARPECAVRYEHAYLAGFELMAAMAPVLALDHYSRGWHSTSALGVLGVALACAVVLDLDEAQTVNALGLAVAQASGTRENFGAMAKSFQAGHCAAAAVRSALLAADGFTASPSAIDGRYGYTQLYAGGEALGQALELLGTRPLAIERVGVDVKKYPCCYAIHRALDALLSMRETHHLSAADIEKIDVLTSARGREALILGEPSDSLQGKFSMGYTLAMAMVDGWVGLQSYRPAAFGRAEVMNLMRRVALVESDGSVLPRWSEVTLHTRDGRRLSRRVQVARGDSPDPLSDLELRAKAAECLQFAHRAADHTGLMDALLPAPASSDAGSPVDRLSWLSRPLPPRP